MLRDDRVANLLCSARDPAAPGGPSHAGLEVPSALVHSDWPSNYKNLTAFETRPVVAVDLMWTRT